MLILTVLIPFLATFMLPILIVRRQHGLWWLALGGLGAVEFAIFTARHPPLIAAAGAAALAVVMALGSQWIVRVGRRRGTFPAE